ncbi:flagellar export chaperone FlgN [Clostridiaceae bacterium 35-E11]
MDSSKIIDVLIDCASKKEEVLRELLQMTINQGNWIKRGDLNQLEETIKQKQLLIEKINHLDGLFLQYYPQLKKHLNIESIEKVDIRQYPVLRQLKLHIGNIMKLLEEIRSIDAQNTENLKEDLNKLKADMKKIKIEKQGAKIALSYTKKYADVQGVFLDNKNKW